MLEDARERISLQHLDWIEVCFRIRSAKQKRDKELGMNACIEKILKREQSRVQGSAHKSDLNRSG